MKSTWTRWIAASAACTGSLLASAASAGIMTYGGTVLNAPAGTFGLVAPRLLDQSGLSAAYVSGVSDFAQYAASGVRHVGSSTTNGSGYLAGAGAVVDIDLGSTLLVSSLALWNDNDAQGVRNFSLSIADNIAFDNAVLLGSFTAQYGLANTLLSYSKGTAAQTFDLDDAVGRYVRVTFHNAHSGTRINVGELVFGAGVPAPVPVPGTLALTGLGLLALAALRRKGGGDA